MTVTVEDPALRVMLDSTDIRYSNARADVTVAHSTPVVNVPVDDIIEAYASSQQCTQLFSDLTDIQIDSDQQHVAENDIVKTSQLRKTAFPRSVMSESL